MDKALRWIKALGGLAAGIAEMIAQGHADRVDEVLPDRLLTQIELARAEAEARVRFGVEA